ncbi:MAG: M48 family metalloprotease [bacterium]|nr:M48 family metalloprotease [bacterium]
MDFDIKRFKNFILIYLGIFSVLAIFGLLGDRNPETLEFALRYFSESEINTGRSYFLYGIIPVTIYRILLITLLAWVVYKGLHSSFAGRLTGKFKGDFAAMILSFLAIFLVLALIKLPVNIFLGFYREKLFGLMNTGFGTWFVRYLASSGISIALSAVTLTILGLIIKKTKRYLLYIPVVFFILGAGYSILWPRFITPLFYDTVPITDVKLNTKVHALAEKAGITVGDIGVIDTSTYSGGANAYLVGLGGERRIFLYDTLLKKFTHEETLSVLAHEMGHYSEEHMLIGMLLGSLSMILVLLLLRFLSRYIFARDLKSMVSPQGHLPLLILLLFLMFISNPVENVISRTIEKRADRYSLELTGDAHTFIEMKKRMGRINRSYLLPNPVYSMFYYTHPPILQRIRLAEKSSKKPVNP